jgi:hypothetical protein
VAFSVINRGLPQQWPGDSAGRGKHVAQDPEDIMRINTRINTVEITDTKGKSFSVQIWTAAPAISSPDDEHWYAMEVGRIIYLEGRVSRRQFGKSTIPEYNIRLQGADDTSGIFLRDYDSNLGTNSSGTGTVAQPWVLNFEPGTITWKIPTPAELLARAVQTRARQQADTQQMGR